MNCSQVNETEHFDDKSTLAEVIVPPINMLLPGLMLTQIYVAIWCHKATMIQDSYVC